MISYFSAGTSLAVKKGNPDKISADDLCGKNVGVQKGAIQVDDLAARSKACTDAGKPAMNSTELQAQTDVKLALAAGPCRGDARRLARRRLRGEDHNGQLELVGQPYDTAPYGMVIGKNQGQYPQAVQGALNALIADGTYKAILDKWGVTDGAVTTSDIKG